MSNVNKPMPEEVEAEMSLKTGFSAHISGHVWEFADMRSMRSCICFIEKQEELKNKALDRVRAQAYAQGREQGRVGERKPWIGLMRWLLGYYDFPEKKEGEGAYWWRKHLIQRLEWAGVNFQDEPESLEEGTSV